jgi:hypothetical protein
METILSFGAGVNSTAIIALVLLGKIPMPDYIVFSDTGVEWPHTYQYLDYLEKSGIHVTYLSGGDCNLSLIEYCQKMNLIPSRMNRWCTDRWKIIPINRFRMALGMDTKLIIGIDAGEAHRAENHPRIYKSFPLIEMGINRDGCIRIIKKAGLGVPKKSGCFICPYQRKRQWVELKKFHPELWNEAVELEKNSIFRSKRYTFITDMTIEEFVSDLDKQEELPFGKVLDQRCECYFD